MMAEASMNTLKNFTEHNRYVELPDPRNEERVVGRYEDTDSPWLKSDLVMIDFYRISYKPNLLNRIAPNDDPENRQPVAGVFLYNPKHSIEWDLDQ